MLKLTQCMIVKNEGKNLPRALGWGKKIVDEQIVVDTGSEDNTVSVAERLGAKVLRYPWNDDFSAAKNFAIGQCTGDWILFLDADEYFSDEDLPCLRPLIEKVNGCRLTKNGKKLRYNVIEMPWINVGSGHIARQSRIFQNIPDLRYVGTVHERLYAGEGGDGLTVYAVRNVPAIYHTGYVWSEENPKEVKGARNFAAAVKGLEKSPDSALLKLYAAEALQQQNKFRQAEEYFAKAMRNEDESIPPKRLREGFRQWLNLYLRMGELGLRTGDWLESAIRARAQAVSIFHEEPDYDMLMTKIFLQAKDVEQAIESFRITISKLNGGAVSSEKRNLYGDLLNSWEDVKRNVPDMVHQAEILPLIFQMLKL